MKRRRFFRNTFNLGFFAMLGIETRAMNIFDRESIIKMNASDSSRSLSNIDDIISRGDIHRKNPPVTSNPWIVLYQGNGRFGSCYGPWGLHLNPNKKSVYSFLGSTQFTHIKHYIRGKFNADYLLPIGSVYWETEPDSVLNYEQYQSFYDGTIVTKFTTSDYAVSIISWFDSVDRDIAGFQIDVKGNTPSLHIATPRSLSVSYGQQVNAAVDEKLDTDLWEADIKCLNTNSVLKVRSNALLSQQENGLKISLKQGKNDILIGVNSDINVSAEKSLLQTKKWWHTTWNNSGWLDLPDEKAQKVWVRSLAYTLFSHNEDGFGDTPPTGLAGNAWPFPFPFDSSCRHLLLLMTGQVNAAKKWIEFWYSRFDGLKNYTKRIFNSEGIFLPHVFPYGSASGYHLPEPPNNYYYPVYNSAILVRLADQTATMVNDPQWTKTYAEPLIHEAANFYLSNLKKGNDGLWHLHIIPSISLDESGDINKPDYVSGLISAQYSLQKAIEYGLDRDQKMRSVLHDGLAYKSLLAENGMYLNHLGLSAKNFGKQKHPDQLFPLVHTPLGPQLSKPDKKAHELRYEITDGAKIPRFLGHTLGEFILASARVHDTDAWLKDWNMIVAAKYTDPDFIQIYESTGNNLIFYVTTHGLFAQAILETVVSTWWNVLDLGACNPWKGTVRFGNIRTLLGVTVDGEIKDGNGHATLDAWKDCKLKYQGKIITLEKGQRITIDIKKSVNVQRT